MSTVEISNDDSDGIIQWTEYHKSRFYVGWLRKKCHCSECSTANNRWPDLDGLRLVSCSITGDDLICRTENRISKQHHTTEIPLDFLREHCNCDKCLNKMVEQRAVSFTTTKLIPSIQYKDALVEEGLLRCMQNILQYGFCIVKGFPTHSNEMAVSFVERMGPLKETFYGYTWDVINTAKPVNAAYTSIKLPFHQDQPFYACAPGVQILFAKRFDDSVQGGESKLVDLLQAADILRKSHPNHFEVLYTIPATFYTIDIDVKGVWYEHSKPHIEKDYFGNISAVNWHPAIEGTLRIREEDVDTYYAAYKEFMKIIRREEIQYRFRLHKGDMMIFNNRRMAHSREAFSAATGERHLLGFYTDIDDVRSTYMGLAQKLGVTASPLKLGNRNAL